MNSLHLPLPLHTCSPIVNLLHRNQNLQPFFQVYCAVKLLHLPVDTFLAAEVLEEEELAVLSWSGRFTVIARHDGHLLILHKTQRWVNVRTILLLFLRLVI